MIWQLPTRQFQYISLNANVLISIQKTSLQGKLSKHIHHTELSTRSISPTRSPWTMRRRKKDAFFTHITQQQDVYTYNSRRLLNGTKSNVATDQYEIWCDTLLHQHVPQASARTLTQSLQRRLEANIPYRISLFLCVCVSACLRVCVCLCRKALPCVSHTLCWLSRNCKNTFK